MQTLRNAGGNWAPGCASADAAGATVAVAARSGAVLLRAADGGFLGELRLPGRAPPRTTAVRFCHALALRHLLAVGADDGAVTVFDAHTRRVVRIVRQQGSRKRDAAAAAVAALCFGADTPDLLFVARADGTLSRVALAEVQKDGVSLASAWEWSIRAAVARPVCMTSVRGSHGVIFVAGLLGRRVESASRLAQEDCSDGVLAAISVVNGGMVSVLPYPPGIVHGLDVTSDKHGDIIAIISGQSETPARVRWRANSLNPVCEDSSWLKASAGSRTSLSASICWLPLGDRSTDETRYLVSSTVSGSLKLWKTDSVTDSVCVGSLNSAHSRQVFAVLPVVGSDLNRQSVVSVSMDRGIRMWAVDSLSSIVAHESSNLFSLTWEICGYGGHVEHIALQKRRLDSNHLTDIHSFKQGLHISANLEGTLIATSSSDGEVYCDFSPALDAMTVGALVPVMRCRLPHGCGSSASTASALCFSDIIRDKDLKHTCLIIGMSNGRIGCVPICFSVQCRSAIRSEVFFSAALISKSKRSAELLRTRAAAVETESVLHVAPVGDRSCLSISSDGVCSVWQVSLVESDGRISAEVSHMARIAAEGLGSMPQISCATSTPLAIKSRGAVSASGPNAHRGVEYFGLILGTVAGCLLVTGFLLESCGRADDEPGQTISLQIGSSRITCVAYSEPEHLIAVGCSDGSVTVASVDWDLLLGLSASRCNEPAALKLVWSLGPTPVRGITSLSWPCQRSGDSPSDRTFTLDSLLINVAGAERVLVSTGGDGTCRALNSLNGVECAVMRGHGGRVLSSAFRSANILLTGGEDCTLREWDIRKQPKPK
jgi:hypothetical protein